MINSIIQRFKILTFIALCVAISSVGSADERVKVVASFSILGDLVQQIGGDYVELVTLVGPDSDAHVYRARPIDAKKISDADIIVVNGLGFEGWFDRLLQSSGFDGQKIVVTDHIPVKHSAEESDHEHDTHSHSDMDPHAWHNIENVKQYVRAITQGLISADPEHAQRYEINRAAYIERLRLLDTEIIGLVTQVPSASRRVITNHDAFGYLAEAYDFEFYAPQGVSTESEASARDVAALITQIREHNIKAVFLENIADDRLMSQIARETQVAIGGKLYSGALSAVDGPASTYIDMMRHNVQTLVGALSQ